MAQIQVALEDGSLVVCRVVERLGYNHDLGATAAWVEYDGKEFCAERRLGAWRKRTAQQRAQPLIEHIERCAKSGEAPFK